MTADGTWGATASINEGITIWDLEAGWAVRRLDVQYVTDLCFAANQNLLAVAYGWCLVIYDFTTGVELCRYAPEQPICNVIYALRQEPGED